MKKANIHFRRGFLIHPLSIDKMRCAPIVRLISAQGLAFEPGAALRGGVRFSER